MTLLESSVSSQECWDYIPVSPRLAFCGFWRSEFNLQVCTVSALFTGPSPQPLILILIGNLGFVDCVYLPGGKVREGQYEPQTPWIYLEPYRSQGSFCLQYLLSVDMRQICSLALSTSVQIPCLSVDFTHALMALFFF